LNQSLNHSATLTELAENAESAAAVLAALGNEKRLAIMCHLAQEELSVGAIAERVDLSQSALSQHLAKLRSMELVQTRRERQMIFYSCQSDRVRHLLTVFHDIFQPSFAAK
jgi:DNA-binding transcriptional ArsR family regulator